MGTSLFATALKNQHCVLSWIKMTRGGWGTVQENNNLPTKNGHKEIIEDDDDELGRMRRGSLCEFTEKPKSHHKHDIYAKNIGVIENMEVLPLPPKEDLPFDLNTYDDVDEPLFDPKIHLDLGMPDYIKCFPDFKPMKTTPQFDPEDNGSRFAYSAPFQIFSEEGIKVIKKIIERERKQGVGPKTARGNKIALRGLYYLSPWIRDLQNCRELRNHFQSVVGEELVPHPSFCNAPQVNLSLDGAKGPVDVWHYDSVAYTGVVLLNDISEMKGGKLEIMQHDKHYALDLLSKGKDYKCEAVGYERPGKMILAQGSEILHHVTPVENKCTRISLIFGYAPANCFQPPKTILKTMQKVDTIHRMANYEFFREKAWQTMNCLNSYVKHMPYTPSGNLLGEKLRAVADELKRAADLLQDIEDDTIKMFDEQKGKISLDINNTADAEVIRQYLQNLERRSSLNGN